MIPTLRKFQAHGPASPQLFLSGPSTSIKAVTVGDIRVLPLDVRHSARGALMFLVKAQGRRLLYTGDFNHINDSVLAHLENVDVMLCKSDI